MIKKELESRKYDNNLVDDKQGYEEFTESIIMKYFNRSLYTLQELTRVLRIDFHYERIFKKYETSYTIETVLLLMTRARKMFAAINMIIKIIKLLEKLKQLQRGRKLGSSLSKSFNDADDNFLRASLNQTPKLDPAEDSPKVKNMKKRIRALIKIFLTENTLFPIQFKFDGKDQLIHLKGPTDKMPDPLLSRNSSSMSKRSRR